MTAEGKDLAPCTLGEHQRPDGSLCPYFVQRPYCGKCGAGVPTTPDLTLGARDPREVDAARSVRLEAALQRIAEGDHYPSAVIAQEALDAR